MADKQNLSIELPVTITLDDQTIDDAEAASTLVLQQQGIFEKLLESKLCTLNQNNLQLRTVAFILFEFTV